MQAGGGDGAGDQGAMISADCLVSAATDYFEYGPSRQAVATLISLAMSR